MVHVHICHLICYECIFSVVVKPPDLNHLRRTLKGELTKMWARLADILEDEIDRFANRLYEKDIIAKGARDKKEYNIMMDAFISSMAVLDTIENIENHCSTLLDIIIIVRYWRCCKNHWCKFKEVMRDCC